MTEKDNDRSIGDKKREGEVDLSIGVVEDEEGEENWLREIKRARKVAIEVAKEHLLSRDMKHMLKAPTRLDFFEEGDYVLVEQGSSFRRGPDDKLLPFLAGPYVVVSRSGDEYLLRNCITQRTKSVHLSNLTAYRVGEYQRSPAEAALRDLNDLFLVDKIVSGVSENDLKGPLSLLSILGGVPR